MKYRRLIALGFLLTVGVAGCNVICGIPGVSKLGLCSPTATPTDTAVATVTPTDTPEMTPTATITATETIFATPVPQVRHHRSTK